PSTRPGAHPPSSAWPRPPTRNASCPQARWTPPGWPFSRTPWRRSAPSGTPWKKRLRADLLRRVHRLPVRRGRSPGVEGRRLRQGHRFPLLQDRERPEDGRLPGAVRPAIPPDRRTQGVGEGQDLLVGVPQRAPEALEGRREAVPPVRPAEG